MLLGICFGIASAGSVNDYLVAIHECVVADLNDACRNKHMGEVLTTCKCFTLNFRYGIMQNECAKAMAAVQYTAA